MIPLRDANPTRRTPVITLSLIALCTVVFLGELWLLVDGGEDALGALVEAHGVVPAELAAAVAAGAWLSEPMLDVITSLFLHAGWFHLLGNLLFLWIFGNNVEDRLGRIVFPLFYLAGAVAAVAAQVAIDPASEVPMIGASGAISATLGAYLVLFPGARIQSLVFLGFFYQLVDVPAVVVLLFWFGLQVVDALAGLGVAGGVDAGIAFFAHIGGFVAGALLALPLRARPAR